MLPDRGLNSRLVRRRASCHVTEHTGLLSTEHADLMYFRPRAAHSDAQVGCAGHVHAAVGSGSTWPPNPIG